MGQGERLLALILVVGALLRAFLVLGPYGEIDGDEAVVGLMALQVPRELPAFFWEQHYLGSLEALAAAALFALFGPSNVALKAVPALLSLLFVGLVYVTARRAFGVGPALLSALYLALPPSFFAVWSTKARGGYTLLLALGQLFLYLCQLLAENELADQTRVCWLAGLAGLVGGLALWTHPLALVYLLAGGGYVALAWWKRGKWGPSAPLSALIGFVVGLLPAIVYNLAEDFPSLRFAAGGGTAPGSALLNLWGLARYGLPVMVGLAEGTASKALLDQDWPSRPGSSPWAMLSLWLLVALVVWRHRVALTGWFGARTRGQGGGDPGSPAFSCPGGERALRATPFVLVLLVVPLVVAVSRFAELWAEPRYALPAYSAVPLVAALVWRLRARSRLLFVGAVTAALAVNAGSLLTSDFRLALMTSQGESRAANRAELIAYLSDRGMTQIYTDYWIGYPLAFESRERIVPAVRSGGFDRRHSYSHLVSTTADPAFVFPAGASGDQEFRQDLAALGGTADAATVSVYHVYTRVRPLEAMRP